MSAGSFLTQSANYYAHAGVQDRYGHLVEGAAVAIRCKFVVKSGYIKGPGGEEVSYDAIQYIALTQNAVMDDHMLFNGVTYRVIKVLEQRGTVTNLQHKKLILQRSLNTTP